jgi:hypothetical protein
VAQLRTALTEQGEGRERDIVDGVAARLADETFAWLREAKEAADMAGDGAAQDVVERARALLERQRALDRRTGTLATLRGRLEELAALEVALLRAQADALNPLPELATVAAQIDSEMARIARVPGVVADPGCGTVAQTLLARLGTADESGLEGVERVVAELERIGLLSEHERVCLRRARRDRLAQRLAREHAEEGRGRRQESAEALRQEWQRVTGSADGATLLVDGHNLLLNPELPYAVEAEAGSSGGERARGALVRDVVWVVSMLPNADARVFFDGPDAQERAGGAGVLVVFSGGSGENRADDRIVDYLHFRATQPRERRVVLVSEDRELRARSRKEDRKSVLLSAAQFDVLRRLASKRRLHATPPNQTHV